MPKPPEATRFPGRIGDWVLANNHQFIAFNKPAGLAVQPDRSEQLSLQQMGAAFCRTDLQAIHRLDQPVSGLILYGKKKSAIKALSSQFRERQAQKTYLAIVGQRPPNDADQLEHHLHHSGKANKTNVVSADHTKAKAASLSYEIIANSDRYFLLRIDLNTGLTHQIRAQLAAIGCPIRGDRKYGFKRSNPGGQIDLHAWKLSFQHPVSKEAIDLTAPWPEGKVWEAFAQLV